MIGTRSPRLLVLAVTLSVAVSFIMVSVFYGQYRSLANQLVASSATQHDLLLRDSFAQHARAQLDNAANHLVTTLSGFDDPALVNTLHRALANNQDLIGIVYTDHSQQVITAGDFPADVDPTTTTWLTESLVIASPVVRNGEEIGVLSGAFELGALRANSASYAARLATAELDSRPVSYMWAGAGTLATLL
ncbi:MAG: hypothetical protein IIA08_09005, partial [Proteobacteria bacterium]|nr:hypothetical protein [Pseudomonadota bacterium]